jgi:DNA-binding GntR family transcriptional regulator
MVVPLKSETMSEKAYQAIKESIVKNEMLPGQTISLHSLVKLLGISQTPVREAIIRLISEGLLESEHHKKTRVAEITENDVKEIFQVRKLLEPFAAEMVMQALRERKDIQSMLNELLIQTKRICNTSPQEITANEYLDIDLALDEIFLKATENTLFQEVLNFVGSRSMRIRTFAEASSIQIHNTLRYASADEHLIIIEAILEGNRHTVRKSVLSHLENGMKRTLMAVKDKLAIMTEAQT